MNDLEKKALNDNTDSDNDSNYEFVTETIKRKPINVKKVVKKITFTIFLAVLFGLVSTITLVVVYPRLYEKFYPADTTKRVMLPVAQEENVEDEIEDFIPPVSDEEDSVTEAEETDNTEDANQVQGEDSQSQEKVINEAATESAESSQDNVVINQIVETIEKSLELSDYRSLIRKISGIATNTEKSLVTVSGRTSNMDWFNNAYEDNNSSIGIILADNGMDLLIIAPTDILHSANNVDVTFNDGLTLPAVRRDADFNTGLCVVAVALGDIPEATMESIEVAQFGSVAASASGTPIVAVGAPFGVAGSMAMGQITSNSIVVDKYDSNVRLISTDIYGSTTATGVLVNYTGMIIGIICHDESMTDMPNLIRAYSAEDIMGAVEKISNGSKLACFGIKGTDVTQDANESFGVPTGAYVKEVIVDTPAMNVGIRNGDVITKMGTKEIASFGDFMDAMLEFRPGDTVAVSLERPSGSNYIGITYDITLEELK